MAVSFRTTIAALLCSIASTAAVAQTTRTLDFSKNPEPVTVASGGVEVVLQPIKGEDDMIDMAAAIRAPGYQSVIVNQDVLASEGYERWVGIAKLSKTDTVPSVLLTGFTGGAHCCSALKVITPVAGKLKVVEFESIDGDSMKILPTDIDGDGLVDFVRQDDSFRYQFSSGAGSYSPPIILNIYKGQLVNVSSDPAFRPIWEDFARKTRADCAERSNDDRNGACAAYVAAGARLGRFQQAMAEAEKMAFAGDKIVLPEPCEVELVNYSCPAGKKIKFYTFPTALRWLLRSKGYID
jgi:hypothetical protein